MSVPISSLKPLKKRKLGTKSLSKKFGSVAPVSLPETLGRGWISTPDQKDSDFCTAYGEAVSTGYKYRRPMSAEWQTAKEGQYLGFPIIQGADAAGSMDAAIVNGSLPREDCTVTLDQQQQSYVADWNNYSSTLDKLAIPFAPGIPYKVDGPYDVFDNIRSALYQAYKTDGAVVKAFGYWYRSFNRPGPNGVVIIPEDSPITLHRYNFIDWEPDGKGDYYLIAALSQGDGFGDKGHLRMNRRCVNYIFSELQNGLGLYISKPASFDWATTIATLRIIIGFLAGRAASLR